MRNKQSNLFGLYAVFYLQENCLLIYKHVNFAKEVLRRQYNHFNELKLTLTLQSSTVLRIRQSSCNFLQIVHSRTNHWIVASTLSSYSKVDRC